jgi:hypothetical protein
VEVPMHLRRNNHFTNQRIDPRRDAKLRLPAARQVSQQAIQRTHDVDLTRVFVVGPDDGEMLQQKGQELRRRRRQSLPTLASLREFPEGHGTSPSGNFVVAIRRLR